MKVKLRGRKRACIFTIKENNYLLNTSKISLMRNESVELEYLRVSKDVSLLTKLQIPEIIFKAKKLHITGPSCQNNSKNFLAAYKAAEVFGN